MCSAQNNVWCVLVCISVCVEVSGRMILIWGDFGGTVVELPLGRPQ